MACALVALAASAAVLAAGYGEAEVRKLWGGNVLRLLRAAEVAAEPTRLPGTSGKKRG